MKLGHWMSILTLAAAALAASPAWSMASRTGGVALARGKTAQAVIMVPPGWEAEPQLVPGLPPQAARIVQERRAIQGRCCCIGRNERRPNGPGQAGGRIRLALAGQIA